MTFSLAAVLAAVTIAAAVQATPASAQSITEKAERDEVAFVSKNDPVMAAAMTKARQTLPDFLKIAAAPPPKTEAFAVKVAIREGAQAEYFWILPFEPKAGSQGDTFTGKLDNTPRLVRNTRMGDTLNFTKAEIVDWMYIDNGVMKGNATACAVMRKGTQKDRDAFKKRFGLDCDL
jgi:uncharacterized protein YegJ (DUF2314 family)